jgi:hypothetical protein
MKRFLEFFVSVLLGYSALAQDYSLTKSPMRNPVPSTARGGVTSWLRPQVSTFFVNMTNLPANKTYNLRVGKMTVLQFRPNSNGFANLAFSTTNRPGYRVMRFDPRGKTIAVTTGTNVVLQTSIATSGETVGTTAAEKARLPRLTGTGSAEATFFKEADGTRRFRVQLNGVTDTNWSVFVNGFRRASIQTTNGIGEVTLRSDGTNSQGRVLNFEPRGQVIDIAQGAVLRFSGKFAARAQDVNVATPAVNYYQIPSTDADSNGTATARLRIDRDANRDFSVELEDVPTGTYQLIANGAVAASIVVVESTTDTRGQIEFSTSEDDDHLPLPFDPLAVVLTIRKDNLVYFRGRLMSTTGVSTLTDPLFIRENLVSTGLIPGANGGAKLEVNTFGHAEFNVQIENVTEGSYEVWVGGVLRGTLVAQLDDGTVGGQLRFVDPSELGRLPLTFDPRGQLLQVRATNGILFTHIFGEGGTNGVSGLPPVRIEVPIFSTGASASATAKAKFERDEDEREFEVEVRNLPAGSYGVLVGGTPRGTLVVSPVSVGTSGRIEFDDDAEDANEFPLTFSPLGEEVVIRSGGTVYFRRVFPPF